MIELLQTASADLMLLADADTFRIALVGAARAGVRLRLDLGIDALAAVDRIQVVSLTPQSVLPLELVYDGIAPDADAALCDRWRKALGSGRCRQCARRAPSDQAKFVCPVRFWGMTKIIEHHQGTTLAGADFSARVLPGDEMRSVTRPSSALIAMSAKVIEALGATVGAATDDAASPIGDLVTRAGAFGAAGVVDGWTTWVEAIERDGPSMLIALPHQGSEDVVGVRDVATLELGGSSLDLFEERHVRRSTDRPGPVMLLLGCNTGVEHRLIASFASKFRPWAPVIIATVGEIIADEAPEVASAIVDELARAWKRRRKTTIGEAVRNTRRALLADSRLVGLQLVMHGDASWGFETSTTTGTG